MKVLVIIGELQKVTDKFDSAVACITDIPHTNTMSNQK